MGSTAGVGPLGVRGGTQLVFLHDSGAAVGDMNGGELRVMCNVPDTLSNSV